MKSLFSSGILVAVGVVFIVVCGFSIVLAQPSSANANSLFSDINLSRIPDVPEPPSLLDRLIEIGGMLKGPAAETGGIFVGTKDEFLRDVVGQTGEFQKQTLTYALTPVRQLVAAGKTGVDRIVALTATDVTKIKNQASVASNNTLLNILSDALKKAGI